MIYTLIYHPKKMYLHKSYMFFKYILNATQKGPCMKISRKFDRHYAITKFNYFNDNLLVVSKGTGPHEDEDGKRLSCLTK
jgi:hypothetical protein